MPRLRPNQVPSYRHHKQSGQAIVTLNGRDFTLGQYNSPDSRTEYNRLIAEWIANGRQLPTRQCGELVLLELFDRYLDFARTYYRTPDGKETSEVGCLTRLIQIIDKTHGATFATDFGPLALEAVRNEMIHLGWVRRSINRYVDRIKRVFKWGVSRELIPSATYEALRSLPGLKRGRCHAMEADPVKPVPEDVLKQTMKFMSRHIKAMVEVQLLTGMRPGELCSMRWCDIDRSGKVWIYAPASHKTQHFGYKRQIAIGPKAQTVLNDFLKMSQQSYVFSAAEAMAEMRAERNMKRRVPLHRGNKPGSNLVSSPRRQPGERYTIAAYRRAITRASKEAAVALVAEMKLQDSSESKEQVRVWERKLHWHPHQLRHNAATWIAQRYGVTSAQVVLGHQQLNTTEIYVERDLAKAQSIIAECG